MQEGNNNATNETAGIQDDGLKAEGASVQVEEPKVETGKKVRPRIFVDKDEKIKCLVTAFYSSDKGDLEFVIQGDVNEDYSSDFIVARHEFVFSRVPYARLNAYRSQCFRKGDDKTTVDLMKLRDLFWKFHLVDWNLTDEEDRKVELERTPDGTLKTGSLELLNSIPSAILDSVISMFETKLSLA